MDNKLEGGRIASPEKISFPENSKSESIKEDYSKKLPQKGNVAITKKGISRTIADRHIKTNQLKPEKTNHIKPDLKKHLAPSEEHLDETKNLKRQDVSHRHAGLNLFLKIVLTIVLCFVFIYIIVNYDALLAKATFIYKDDNVLEYNDNFSIKNMSSIDSGRSDLVFLPIIMGFPKPDVVDLPPKEEEKAEELVPEESVVQNVNYPASSDSSSYSLSNTLNNQLFIPSLGIQVPVVWDSPVDENTMLANLQHGVVNYLGTAKPGEGLENNTGNVFISGHSSYYSWDSGKYKSIFATLPYINIGDKVAIGYYDKVYVYEVYDKTEVSPDNVDVVRQDTSEHIVTLMTCVPVGTNERRLIVRARFTGYAE